MMKYEKITSVSNQHVKDAVQIREKRAKFRNEAFLIEGPHLVEMALKREVRIKEVFMTESFISNRENRTILGEIEKSAEAVFEVSDQVIKKLTDTETPQGIAAIAGFEAVTLDRLHIKTSPLIVVMDSVQDPGNLGTIIRTADAADADAVILLAGCCDAFMPKVIRATAGSIFNIPLVYSESGLFVSWLKKNRIRLAVTSVDSEMSVFENDLRGGIAFVFGNEAHGVSSSLRNAADLSVKVPILGRAESLNVATSAAVCLYEAMRQRNHEEESLL